MILSQPWLDLESVLNNVQHKDAWSEAVKDTAAEVDMDSVLR